MVRGRTVVTTHDCCYSGGSRTRSILGMLGEGCGSKSKTLLHGRPYIIIVHVAGRWVIVKQYKMM